MADVRGPMPTGAYDGRTVAMWLALALLVAFPAAVSVYGAVHVVRPAPDFHLTTTGLEAGFGSIAEPAPLSLSGERGKTVVLDLMAVACKACREVTRDTLKPLWAELGGREDFTILSIDTWADPQTGNAWGGETAETLSDLQRSEGTPWRHALDTDQVWLTYSAVTLPRVVVVDGGGHVVFDQVGVPAPSAVRSAVAASLAASATPVPFLSLGLPALAFAAGIASVLSPCSVGLVPAYFGLLLQEGGKGRSPLRAGLAASLGVVALYALLAIAFALTPGLGGALPWMGPAVAVAMVAVGAWSLAGRGVPGLARLANRVDARRGFLAFGAAFGLAGFACNGPLFLPILLAGFTQGAGDGVLLFVLYAAAVAAALAVAAWMVAAGQETRLRSLLVRAAPVQRLAGVLLVGSGLYLLWYFLR